MEAEMTSEEIKHLRNLARRANDEHVIGYGSTTTVIYAAEFYALETAIDELARKARKARKES